MSVRLLLTRLDGQGIRILRSFSFAPTWNEAYGTSALEGYRSGETGRPPLLDEAVKRN